MCSRGKTNLFKERMILQEEEKSLKKMRDKFQDQLHRLKVEELALLHLMRIEKEKESQAQQVQDSNQPTQNTVPASSRVIDVSVSGLKPTYSENLSSGSEDEGESEFSDMVAIGYEIQDQYGTENVEAINEEKLDLKVTQGPSTSLAGSMFENDDDEEEEEEEEEDSIVMEEDNAESDGEGLKTFMDG